MQRAGFLRKFGWHFAFRIDVIKFLEVFCRRVLGVLRAKREVAIMRIRIGQPVIRSGVIG